MTHAHTRTAPYVSIIFGVFLPSTCCFSNSRRAKVAGLDPMNLSSLVAALLLTPHGIQQFRVEAIRRGASSDEACPLT